MRCASLLLAVLVAAGAPSVAAAGDPRIDQFVQPAPSLPPVRDPRADQFVRDNSQPTVVVPEAHRHGRRHGDGPAPQNIIVVSPFVVAPSIVCRPSGSWTYQWVPQTTTTQAWVPGHWAPNGAWIDEGWQTQTVATGYWQPVWVPDDSGC